MDRRRSGKFDTTNYRNSCAYIVPLSTDFTSMSNTNKYQDSPIDQLPMQKTVSLVDLSDDDDDEDKDVILNTFHRKSSLGGLFNDDFFKVSYPFSTTINRHLKHQAPMAPPKQKISHFTRVPGLVPMPHTKQNIGLVNGQSNNGRDTSIQSRSNLSLKKNTLSPLIRTSYVSAFQQLHRYILVIYF